MKSLSLVLRSVSCIVVGAACSPRFVALEPSLVQSLAVVPPEPTATFCANVDAIPLRALITYQDGRRLSNAALPGEKLDARIRPGELIWSADLGEVDAEARLRLPGNRFAWIDQPVTIRVTSARDPKLWQATTLVPRYDCGLVNVSGRDGADGGQAGAPGPDVEVVLSYAELPRGRMVAIRPQVAGGAPQARYLLDPKAPAGSFTVAARGGNGGDGAQGAPGATGERGERGRHGSDGRDGADCTSGGDGGRGGNGGPGADGETGGDGGDGGNGGAITVAYQEDAPEIVHLLRYDVTGGAGGNAGAGGDAGPGGSGGPGGHGGRGGTSKEPGHPCGSRDGRDGRSGDDGPFGSNGASGRSGRQGRNGEVRTRPMSVAAFVDSFFAPPSAPASVPATTAVPW